MKARTLFLEFDPSDYGNGRFVWIPGSFSAPFKGGTFRRVWWGCWAVAWVSMPLHEYNAYVASGKTEWRDK